MRRTRSEPLSVSQERRYQDLAREKRAKLADERSLGLFRCRAQIIAEIELEEALCGQGRPRRRQGKEYESPGSGGQEGRDGAAGAEYTPIRSKSKGLEVEATGGLTTSPANSQILGDRRGVEHNAVKAITVARRDSMDLPGRLSTSSRRSTTLQPPPIASTIFSTVASQPRTRNTGEDPHQHSAAEVHGESTRCTCKNLPGSARSPAGRHAWKQATAGARRGPESACPTVVSSQGDEGGRGVNGAQKGTPSVMYKSLSTPFPTKLRWGNHDRSRSLAPQGCDLDPRGNGESRRAPSTTDARQQARSSNMREAMPDNTGVLAEREAQAAGPQRLVILLPGEPEAATVASAAKKDSIDIVARVPGYHRGELPAFVVIGLAGVFAERALLLPTPARELEMVPDKPATVNMMWECGSGRRRLQLTRMKAKPAVCNPLPALATALAWAREIDPHHLGDVTLPDLPQSLAPEMPRAAPKVRANMGKASTRDAIGLADGIPEHAGASPVCASVSPLIGEAEARRKSNRVLSIGAAWLLAHIVFGKDATGWSSRPHTGGRGPPCGVVSTSGAEAAALSLLSCPDIGWAPNPEDVANAVCRGGGSMWVYAVSVAAEQAQEGRQEVRKAGLQQAACEELVEAGLCTRSEDGGCLVLAAKVASAFEICLQIYVYHWGPERQTLAGVAIGMIKTGPMTSHGVAPTPMQTFLASANGSTRAASAGRASMRGRIGLLCVRLHAWCFQFSRGTGSISHVKNLLWQIHKMVVPGDTGSARAWNGPMAEALGLLGGSSSKKDADAVWVSSLTRRQRLVEPACMRLKDAVAQVLNYVCVVIADCQAERKHQDAILLLYLLLRRDKDLAGEVYRDAPDLLWAADWCAARLRGWAWIRLSANLERQGEYARCLEVLHSACEDEHVKGGDLVEIRDRTTSKHRKYGDRDDTPPASPFRQDSEEQVVVAMNTGKGGNKRSTRGGRILFFDKSGTGTGSTSVKKRGLVVEGVALRIKRDREGWLGLHCETRGIMFLMMLLLWEEVFDKEAQATAGHCFASRPFDLYDAHFCTRRKGLPARLEALSRTSDESLWMDVGLRFDRFKDVRCAWCYWRELTKQQMMEMAVAFGGRKLSHVLRALTANLQHMHSGFPDLILWRPRVRKGETDNAQVVPRRTKAEFGLAWDGEGLGWEVQVVEVKSENDTLSYVQRAWLAVLRDAGVPATVMRIVADSKKIHQTGPLEHAAGLARGSS